MSDGYQEQWLEREFIGYGFSQPNPEWPQNAKICVSFVVQFNSGAVGRSYLAGVLKTESAQESNVEDGDPMSCTDYLEIPSSVPQPFRVEPSEMIYEYGGREGVPRLLKLFTK